MTSAQDRHRILEAGQKLKLVPSGGKPSSLPVLLVLYAYSSLLLALGCFSFRVFQSVTREQRFDCSETRTVLNLEDVTAAFLAVCLSLSLSLGDVWIFVGICSLHQRYPFHHSALTGTFFLLEGRAPLRPPLLAPSRAFRDDSCQSQVRWKEEEKEEEIGTPRCRKLLYYCVHNAYHCCSSTSPPLHARQQSSSFPPIGQELFFFLLHLLYTVLVQQEMYCTRLVTRLKRTRSTQP